MIARLLPSLVLQLLAIAVGWEFLIAALGQGAKYLLAGWWASLLGLVMLIMGLVVPAIGLVAGLLPSLILRLPRALNQDDFMRAATGAGLLHAAAYLVLGLGLWLRSPGRPGPNADYDGGFLLVTAVLALGFGQLAAMAAGAIVARRPLRLDP